jgi:hypothetical protein
MTATAAQAAPELSTTNRLQDRREVAAGQRSYVEGFQDGRFYANGWHTTGEMGGVWSPPLKLVDGVWFGVGDEWVGPAAKFSSGWGYTRFALPDAGGLRLERTDFAPDGRRAVLFGLRLTNPAAAAKTVTVKVDAHSELLSAYPWGFTGVTPNASDNIADHGAYASGALQFTDDGALPGAPEHHYAALVGSNRTPASGEAAETGGAYRGPQGANVCSAQEPPSACDDGPFGKGTGGELRYSVTVPGGASRTVWVAVAGSDKGIGPARSELAAALRDPAGALAARSPRARACRAGRRSRCLGHTLLQRAVDWGKQNIADLTQTASDLQIRWTNQGHQFRRRWAQCRSRAGSAPATRTTRGSSPPTANTRTSRPSPSGGSRSPRTTSGAAGHLRHPQRPLGDRRPRGRLRRLDLVRPRLADDGAQRHEDERLQHRRGDQVPERGGADLALDG